MKLLATAHNAFRASNDDFGSNRCVRSCVCVCVCGRRIFYRLMQEYGKYIEHDETKKNVCQTMVVFSVSLACNIYIRYSAGFQKYATYNNSDHSKIILVFNRSQVQWHTFKLYCILLLFFFLLLSFAVVVLPYMKCKCICKFRDRYSHSYGHISFGIICTHCTHIVHKCMKNEYMHEMSIVIRNHLSCWLRP